MKTYIVSTVNGRIPIEASSHDDAMLRYALDCERYREDIEDDICVVAADDPSDTRTYPHYEGTAAYSRARGLADLERRVSCAYKSYLDECGYWDPFARTGAIEEAARQARRLLPVGHDGKFTAHTFSFRLEVWP